MAQYKVPQDVEADDKLIGPFNFRQFIYLIVMAALGGIAFLLFRIFPLLVIIPIPFIIFFGILALPIKKDQPMETYLSAIVSYYMKPRTRLWEPGQGETTIVITAPKHTDEIHTKGLSEDEASRRLSFLADIVDTEGYAIKGERISPSNLHDDFYSEASQAQDIFETAAQNTNYQDLNVASQNYHASLVNQMRQAINNNNSLNQSAPPQNTPQPSPTSPNIHNAFQPPVPPASSPFSPAASPASTQPVNFDNPVVIQPINETPITPKAPFPSEPAKPFTPQVSEPASINTASSAETPTDTFNSAKTPEIAIDSSQAQNDILGSSASPRLGDTPAPNEDAQEPEQPSPEIFQLAHNNDRSIESLAREAKKIEENQNNDGEVYISLH